MRPYLSSGAQGLLAEVPETTTTQAAAPAGPPAFLSDSRCLSPEPDQVIGVESRRWPAQGGGRPGVAAKRATGAPAPWSPGRRVPGTARPGSRHESFLLRAGQRAHAHALRPEAAVQPPRGPARVRHQPGQGRCARACVFMTGAAAPDRPPGPQRGQPATQPALAATAAQARGAGRAAGRPAAGARPAPAALGQEDHEGRACRALCSRLLRAPRSSRAAGCSSSRRPQMAACPVSTVSPADQELSGRPWGP